MTNYQKFIEVFGFKPDKKTCIPICPDNLRETACEYFLYSDNPLMPHGGCNCERWWDEEYNSPSDSHSGE